MKYSLKLIADTQDRRFLKNAEIEYWEFEANSSEVDANKNKLPNYPISNGSICFMVPDDGDFLDESLYMVYNTAAYNKLANGRRYNVSLYSRETDSMFSDIILIKSNNTESWDNRTVGQLVNDIMYSVGKDETETTVVRTLLIDTSGTTNSLEMAPSVSVETVYGTTVVVDGEKISEYVDEGDIIITEPGLDGYTHSIRMLFDYSEDSAFWGYTNGVYNYKYDSASYTDARKIELSSRARYCYGYVFSQYRNYDEQYASNTLSLFTTADFITNSAREVYPLLASNTKYAFFDSQRRNTRAYYGVTGDVIDCENICDTTKATKVFIQWNRDISAVNGIVFYK